MLAARSAPPHPGDQQPENQQPENLQPENLQPGNQQVVTVATALIEADGRIVHWSSGAEALLGYTAAEAVGSYAVELIGSMSRGPRS